VNQAVLRASGTDRDGWQRATQRGEVPNRVPAAGPTGPKKRVLRTWLEGLRNTFPKPAPLLRCESGGRFDGSAFEQVGSGPFREPGVGAGAG